MKKIKDKNNPVWRYFVGDNKNVVNEIKYLIQSNQLPLFTVGYFQDLDMKLHKYGPTYSKAIKKVDERIKQLLNAFPSWDEALSENIFIILSDNGQTPVGNNRTENLIDLRAHYKNYKVAKVRKNGRIKPKDEIILCVNQRMAYIYSINKDIGIDELISNVKTDNRIDLIVSKTDSGIRVLKGGQEGDFHFRLGGHYVDMYQQAWTIQGEEAILDLKINDKQIQYGIFPDALLRLYAAMNSHEGTFIVVNAKPVYEFIADLTPNHLGGAAHGSLYKRESLVPLLFTGTTVMPTHNRILNMKPWLLKLVEEELNF
jgi:hypothetical protein